MKKITLLLLLLSVSFGYSQVVLEDFETLTPGSTTYFGFEGLGSAGIVANPSVDANNGSATVGELIVVQAGQPWQGAKLVMQDNYMDVSDPATMPVTVKVYSDVAFSMLAKLEDGQNSAPDSAVDANHTGMGWETLTFTFNNPLDTTTENANGEYGGIAFFPNWNGAGWHDPEIENTVYIDDVTAFQGAPLVSDPIPSGPAPNPTAPDGEVFNLYSDTGGYTSNMAYDYCFGTLDGEPNLDDVGGINNAQKYDFGSSGFGCGQDVPTDVSSKMYVNFDYWASTSTTNFRAFLISGVPPGATTETFYEIGVDEAIVQETWTRVSVPISHFTGQGFDIGNYLQYKFDVATAEAGSIVYIDNYFLSDSEVLSVNQFAAAEFNVFPNPTENSWNVRATQSIDTIEVFDMLGKRVMALNPETADVTLNASELNSGLYFAKITTASGTNSIKLIKK